MIGYCGAIELSGRHCRMGRGQRKTLGIFGVADSLRPEAVEAVTSLKKMGVQVVMLTGDSDSAAAAVHSKLGDIDVHSQLLPENEVNQVKELKTRGVTVMVGDGINDAPALAAADIGFAMGVAGAAVAMETADVALMTNDLRKLVVAIKLGKNWRWKTVQNVSLSFFTKITIIIIAAAAYSFSVGRSARSCWDLLGRHVQQHAAS